MGEDVEAYEQLADRFAGDSSPAPRGRAAAGLLDLATTLSDRDLEQELLAVQRAARLYQELVTVDPDAFKAELANAQRRLEQISYQAAVESFKQALRLSRDGKSRQAVAVYSSLLARFGDDSTMAELVAKALFNKAINLRRLQLFAEAVLAYDELLAKVSEDPALAELVADARINRATCLRDIARRGDDTQEVA